MADDKTYGWVLAPGESATVEPRHFGDGVPGLWLQDGDPVTSEQLGMDADDFRQLVKDKGLPLVEVANPKKVANITMLRGRGVGMGGHINPAELGITPEQQAAAAVEVPVKSGDADIVEAQLSGEVDPVDVDVTTAADEKRLKAEKKGS